MGEKRTKLTKQVWKEGRGEERRREGEEGEKKLIFFDRFFRSIPSNAGKEESNGHAVLKCNLFSKCQKWNKYCQGFACWIIK